MTRTETLRTAAHQCKDEEIKKPAKLWRNWVRAVAAHNTYCPEERLEHWKVGDIYHGTRLWPSKDSAETYAARAKDFGRTENERGSRSV